MQQALKMVDQSKVLYLRKRHREGYSNAGETIRRTLQRMEAGKNSTSVSASGNPPVTSEQSSSSVDVAPGGRDVAPTVRARFPTQGSAGASEKTQLEFYKKRCGFLGGKEKPVAKATGGQRILPVFKQQATPPDARPVRQPVMQILRPKSRMPQENSSKSAPMQLVDFPVAEQPPPRFPVEVE